jgi:hypothetical protein
MDFLIYIFYLRKYDFYTMEDQNINSCTVLFSNNLSEEIFVDRKYGATTVLMNEDEEKNIKQVSYLKRNTLQNFCTYTMSFLISIVIGYSFSSYALIIDHGLRDYSSGFFDDYHELFKNMCPAILYFGSTVGTFFMLMIKHYSHLRVIQLSLVIFSIGYLLQMVYPHILVIFLARFSIGIASGVSSMIIPQILYYNCKENMKGFFTSLFPSLYLAGITIAVALIPLVTPENYLYFNLIPLGLVMISAFCGCRSFKLKDVEKDKGFIEVVKFMFEQKALKSTILIILAHFVQKATGVDFIGNFSNSFFEGENAHIFSLIPLIVAAVVNLATGAIPDVLGRKLPIVTTSALLCLILLSMGMIGTNVYSLVLFTIIYNCGLGSIPYYFQNETVPIKYIPEINEIGTFSNVLLALFVAIYAALQVSPSNKTIWLTFFGLTLIGSIVLGITMPET